MQADAATDLRVHAGWPKALSSHYGYGLAKGDDYIDRRHHHHADDDDDDEVIIHMLRRPTDIYNRKVGAGQIVSLLAHPICLALLVRLCRLTPLEPSPSRRKPAIIILTVKANYGLYGPISGVM